jgi:ABC-type uncharacterized transport system ATPase subunit
MTGMGATAPAGAPALELDNVTAGYDSSTVLRDLSLTVPAGNVTVLLGANGAGKPVTDLRLSFVGGGTVAGSAGGWPWLASAAVPRRYRRDMA